MWYPNTCAAIGFADVRAGTQMIAPIQSGTRVLTYADHSQAAPRTPPRAMPAWSSSWCAPVIQCDTRVLVPLWDSLMFGRVLKCEDGPRLRNLTARFRSASSAPRGTTSSGGYLPPAGAKSVLGSRVDVRRRLHLFLFRPASRMVLPQDPSTERDHELLASF